MRTRDFIAEREAQLQRQIESIDRGGGNGQSIEMESRVTRLEVESEQYRRDIAEIKGDLKTIVARLATLPTKDNLLTYTLSGLGLGLALMALTIGGIIGGLSWIRPDPVPAVAAPAVIYVPSPFGMPAPQPAQQ